MTVKLAILKSGENIISDIKEGFYKEKLVCYVLEKPCTVSINGNYRVIGDDEEKVSISLKTWPPLSDQTIVEIVPEWVVTLVEPKEELKKMYQEQVLEIEQNDETIIIDKQFDPGLPD